MPGQAIPGPETVPVPLPANDTLTFIGSGGGVTAGGGGAWADAVTVVSAVMITVQGWVPAQPPPDHPTNGAPSTGVSVNVTAVPCGNVAEQLATSNPGYAQSIPAGELDTVPAAEYAGDHETDRV